jgi:hypothetical protein
MAADNPRRGTNRLTALQVRRLGPGMYCDGGGLYARIHAPGFGSWIFRFMLAGKAREMGLGSLSVVSLAEAREKAHACRKLSAAGIDPIAHRNVERTTAPVRTLEQRVAQKALEFLEQNIEPACYLYRHYHPSGDLLYVGVSLQPLKRQDSHLKGAAWRNMIVRIVIEPFAAREEALAAEQAAIRDEFPKFNTTHNRRHHPIEELRAPREHRPPPE